MKIKNTNQRVTENYRNNPFWDKPVTPVTQRTGAHSPAKEDTGEQASKSGSIDRRCKPR